MFRPSVIVVYHQKIKLHLRIHQLLFVHLTIILRGRAGYYQMIDNQRGAYTQRPVGYNHFISSKPE